MILEAEGETITERKADYNNEKVKLKKLADKQLKDYVATKEKIKEEIKETRKALDIQNNRKFIKHQLFFAVLTLLVGLGFSSAIVVYGSVIVSLGLMGVLTVKNIYLNKVLKVEEEYIEKCDFYVANQAVIETNSIKRMKHTGKEKVDVFNLDKTSLLELKALLEYKENDEPVKSYVKKYSNKRR